MAGYSSGYSSAYEGAAAYHHVMPAETNESLPAIPSQPSPGIYHHVMEDRGGLRPEISPTPSRHPSSTTNSGYSAVSYVSDKNGAVFYEQPLQQPLQQQQQQQQRHHVLRFWPWELLSLVVSIGLIVATAAILAHYDGQQMPEWPFSINLNTLVALLSTILRAAMLVSVAAVISQVKWTWFSRPRSLKDLQDFDSASRGVRGSIRLLFVAPTSPLAVIGALVTILSLAIGPFTQQAVKTTSCARIVAGANASVPLAHYMPGRSGYYRVNVGDWQVEVDMKGAMVNGLTNPSGNDSVVVATCSSGNCTFPVDSSGISYSSIGMCSVCVDTTSLVAPSNNVTTNYTLPNNMWLGPMVKTTQTATYLNVHADSSLEWASSVFTEDFTAVAGSSLTNMTVLAVTNAPCWNSTKGVLQCPHNVPALAGPSDYVATSCALYPCLKNFNADVSGGLLNERLVSTSPALAPINDDVSLGQTVSGVSWNFTALKTPCVIDGVEYGEATFSEVPRTPGRIFTDMNIAGTTYSVPDECRYNMFWQYGMAMSEFMSTTLFNGKCTYGLAQGPKIYCSQAFWLSVLYNNQEATFDSISSQIDQFATAVTNKFRSTGSSNSNTSIAETAVGTVVEMTICTSFDWRWLLLPVFLVMLAVAISVVMVVQNYLNREQPVWKSSILPMLFYGFGHSPEMGPRPVMDLSQMDRQASDTRARFQSGMDAGFVGVPGPGARTAMDLDTDSLMGDGHER